MARPEARPEALSEARPGHDLDTAFDIEGRYFVELATGQISKNMIKALFFDVQAASAPA